MVWVPVWSPRAAGSILYPMTPSILIVDDHRTFRTTARALLEADGFDVVGEAADGLAGLAAAVRLRPDVVLVDVRLPDLDGFTVTERMTGVDGAPVVIVTSSSDDPLYPERAARAGARAFVAKHDVSGRTLEALLPGP